MFLYEDVMKEELKIWFLAYYRFGSFCDDVDNNVIELFNIIIIVVRVKAIMFILEIIRR